MQLHSIRVLGAVLVAVLASACSDNSVPQQNTTAQQAPPVDQRSSGLSADRNPAQASPPALSGTYVSAGDNSLAIIRLVNTSGSILGEFDLVKFDAVLGQSTTQATQTLNVKGNADDVNIAITLSAQDDNSTINMTGTHTGSQIELTYQGTQTNFVRMSSTELQNALLTLKHQSQAEAVKAEEEGANRDASDNVQSLTDELTTFADRAAANPDPFRNNQEWWSEFQQNPSDQENLFHAHVVLTQSLEKLVELDTGIALSPCSANSSLSGCDQYFAAAKKYAGVRSSVLDAIEAKRTEWIKYACAGGVANIGVPNTVTPMVDLCTPTVHMPTITALSYGDPSDISNAAATPTIGEVKGGTASVDVTTEGNGAVVIRFDSDPLVGVARGPGSMMNEVAKQTVAVNGTAHAIFNITLPQKGTDGTPRAPIVELPVVMTFNGMGYPNESALRVGTVFLKETTGLE